MKTMEFCSVWLTVKKRSLSPTTEQSYADALQRVILPFFGDMEIEKITPLDVEMFVAALYGRNLASETIRRYLAIFRSMMTKAVTLGLISGNPAEHGKIEPIRRKEQSFNVLDDVGLMRLLSAVDSVELRWKVYVYFALDTGARRGECVGLQWKDIQGREVWIRRSGYKLTGKPKATKEPKGRRSRKVYVAARTAELLGALRREQKKNCLKVGKSWKDSFFVFGDFEEMLHPSSPTSWFSKFLKRHNLPKIRLHDLRHTSATQLLLHGVDLRTVSGRLGHADLEVTQRYLHFMADADKDAAEKVDLFLYQNKKMV